MVLSASILLLYFISNFTDITVIAIVTTYTKIMDKRLEQNEEITQNWTEPEQFDIYFHVVFDRYC